MKNLRKAEQDGQTEFSRKSSPIPLIKEHQIAQLYMQESNFIRTKD